MTKVKHESFNDGILQYGEVKAIFAEGVNKKIGEELVPKGKLCFRNINARESDYILADARGSVLDRKVKAPYHKNLKNTDKVMIEGALYDVIKLDDENKRFWYIYLQKAGLSDDK